VSELPVFFELIEDGSKNNLVSELKPVLFASEWNVLMFIFKRID